MKRMCTGRMDLWFVSLSLSQSLFSLQWDALLHELHSFSSSALSSLLIIRSSLSSEWKVEEGELIGCQLKSLSVSISSLLYSLHTRFVSLIDVSSLILLLLWRLNVVLRKMSIRVSLPGVLNILYILFAAR